jgi:hypothetical protein
MVVGVILFALIGFAAGYALSWPWPLLVLIIPILFALLALSDFGGTWVVRLIISLAVTAAAIVAGRLIAERFGQIQE